MSEELAARLGLALAIGLLVGLERGWRERDAPDRSRTAGMRTYGISGLLGGIFALLSDAMDAASILVAGFLAFASVLTLYKLREAIADDDYSVTGVIAGLAVFVLGALAVAGDQVLAAGGGAALTAILASREVLHRFLRRLSWEELRAALILAAMTAIVLPLLPDRTVDPWGGINPHEIWLFTILVATLSYLGYVATRLFGEGRGLLLSTLLGAVVSSTAVTVALARRRDEAPAVMAGAAALAAAVSISRVCVIVLVVAPAVLTRVAMPAMAAALVFSAFGGILLLRLGAFEAESAKVRNPFELTPLLVFASSFAIIAGANAYMTQAIGAAGMLATSALSGVMDVDVAVLSAARQLDGGSTAPIDASSVADAVLMALVANAGGRTLLAGLAGNRRFLAWFASTTLAAGGVGAAIHAL